MSQRDKSLAVESMHRLHKHFSDTAEGVCEHIPDEVLEIHEVWANRDQLTGDLNACLQQLRAAKADGGKIPDGWKRKGRKFTST